MSNHIYLYKRCAPVHGFVCVSGNVCACLFFGGKPSIYFLVNIGYFLRPSVVSCRRRRRRPLSVRPVVRPVVVVVRPLSVRPRPSRRRRRPLSVRPVVRLIITYMTSRSIRRICIYLFLPIDNSSKKGPLTDPPQI